MANPELLKMVAAVEHKPTQILFRALLDELATQKSVIIDLERAQKTTAETVEIMKKRLSSQGSGDSSISVG